MGKERGLTTDNTWTRALLAAVLALVPGPLIAQRPVTLAEAVDAALAAPRMAVARADSAAAAAGVRLARAFPNPSLSFDYSVAVPTHHLILEQPLEYPWVRSARIRAAATGADAADRLLAAERAAIRYDVEAAYVGAAGARRVREISARNVRDAGELVRIARARREAGDASELDVNLASVAAGQARSAFLTDSLAEVSSVLELQALMGLDAASVEIVPVDSLEAAPSPPAPLPALPARLQAARLELTSQEAALSAARRARLPVPALRGGVEEGDPDQKGLLATYGISLPLPLWSRGGAEVASAKASLARARAELAQAEILSRALLAQTERRRAVAGARLEADSTMVRDAERVAALSLTAYNEGAYPLASVLEAQRSARDALRQFIEDQVENRTAAAAYVLARTAGPELGGGATLPTPTLSGGESP